MPMRKIFRLFKHLILFMVIAFASLYFVLYVLISIPHIQNQLRAVSVEALTEVLYVPLSIERVKLSPFSRVELFGTMIPDQQGDTLLYAKKIGAGINYYDLILVNQISLDNIQLFGADVRIKRETPISDTNIQFIIDAFAQEEQETPPPINLRINSAMIRRCKVSYDVLSERRKEKNLFDPNHIAVQDLTTTIALRSFNRDSINVHIKRLACKEQSGLTIDRLTLQAKGNRDELSLTDFDLKLPHSHIATNIATIDMRRMAHESQWSDSLYISFGIENSHIRLSDISAFTPILRQFHTPITISCYVNGSPNNIHVDNISLKMSNGAVAFNTSANIKHLLNTHDVTFNCNPLRINTTSSGTLLVGRNMGIADEETIAVLKNLGGIKFDGRVNGSSTIISAHASLYTNVGDLQADLTLQADTALNHLQWKGFAASDGIDLAQILGEKSQVGFLAFSSDLEGSMRNKKMRQAKFNGRVDRIDYNRYSYNDIIINAQYNNNRYSGVVEMNDPNGSIAIDGTVQLEGKNALADVEIKGKDLDLGALNLVPSALGNKLSFNVDANYTGNQIDNANGYIHISDIQYGNEQENIKLNEVKIEAYNDTLPQQIIITSDIFNGSIQGQYALSTLGKTFMRLADPILPTEFETKKDIVDTNDTSGNNFDWHFTMKPYIKLSQLLQLPFTLTDTATIAGYIYDTEQDAELNIIAPNIWFGLTHMEKLNLNLNYKEEQIDLNAHTNILNAQQKPTLWELAATGKNNQVSLSLGWNGMSQPAYNGSIKLNSLFARNEENRSQTDIFVDILPSEVVINDTVWNVAPASIAVQGKHIAIEDVKLSRPSQHLYIDGCISTNEMDTLFVDLQDVSLDYIFETLNIDFVTFGGRATGRVDVANLYGDKPHLVVEELKVRDFSYNDAVFGSLSAYSHFDTDNMGILLKGIITNPQQRESYVDGYIFPTRDSISIAFDVDYVPLTFLGPFLQTIMTDVEGYGSGKVVLEGNFERITVHGDAYAHSFSFGVPFINTHYTLSDSIHLTKNQIRFDNISAKDDMGNTAMASGIINHQYFMNVDYDIRIFDARDILAFDVNSTPGAMYYGTIFGSGDVSIKGNEAYTNIDVNMTTSPNSKFTFALTNTTSAMDYPFLSFTNKEEEALRKEREALITEIDSFVMHNNMLMERKIIRPMPTNTLNVSIVGHITPESEITILMNEITGDKLQGHGDGTLRLDYNTADNAIFMQGTVTIDNGFYDFSIEDIITRNFKIQQGGTVSFNGDPLDAVLNVDAIYSLQANLADLDESFTTDGELTRTTVPVDAIMHIDGVMLSPDITFNINLPTLSADMESRMRSTIGGDEMMTKQVIYLLVLNRFFTPEYTNQSSYNQWGAMAASTLSSSIGALMGQLTDNWSISPQLRSDRGDFSDVEVNLFLSSQLLNNRLIFNGNLGYRDSRYSSTNFIGDFDIEYLLTEGGNLRLKGYNHFNDRNYSMRTALTTQGIGLVYKHDFNAWNNFFEFTKPIRLFDDDEDDEYEYEYKYIEIEYEDDDYEELIEQSDSILTIIPDILE